MWSCWEMLYKMIKFVWAKVQVVSDTFETLHLLHAKSEVKGLFQDCCACLFAGFCAYAATLRFSLGGQSYF